MIRLRWLGLYRVLHSYPEVPPLLLIPLLTGCDFLFYDQLRSQAALFVISITLLLNLVLWASIKLSIAIFRRSNSKLSFLHRHSFPSLHTQAAFCFAVAASSFYPSFSPVFLSLAGVYGVSRLILKVHSVSDVFGGALMGTTVASAGTLFLHQYSTPVNTVLLGIALHLMLILVPTWMRHFETARIAVNEYEGKFDLRVRDDL